MLENSFFTEEITEDNKILIIEDNLIFVKILSKFLENQVKCDHVTSIRDFLDKNLHQYSMILLDLSLPDSNGIETVSTVIKKFRLPVIVISATNDFEIMRKCVKIGAQDYLIKGQFDQNLLLKSILFAYERFQRIQFEDEISLLINEISKLRSDFRHLQEDFTEMKSVLCQK